MWTLKYDADGKVLKRHEHDDDVDRRDSKRVRFTHKQPGKLADMELTDDTAAKRAKLFDTPSPNSASHEVAPNLLESTGETEHPETQVGSRSITANNTLHRLMEEISLE